VNGETDHLFDEDLHPVWCSKCEHWSENCRCEQEEDQHADALDWLTAMEEAYERYK